MGYIEVPVHFTDDLIFQNEIVDWFSVVHAWTPVEFDFSSGGLNLYNPLGKKLTIYNSYDEDSLFDLIEPKTKYGASEWTDAKVRCHDTVKFVEDRIGEFNWKDRQIFDAYLHEKKMGINTWPAWYVRDIKLNVRERTKEEKEEGWGIMYSVLLEIVAIRENIVWANKSYFAEKNYLEDTLVQLYRNISDDISIPGDDEKDKKIAVAKMIFELKGICEFKDVDNLDLRNEHIRKTKYPWLKKTRISHPKELMPSDIIEEVTYEFPKEESWAEVISAMGMFSTDDNDDTRIVQICEENIAKTVRFMMEDKKFKRTLYDPIELSIGRNNNMSAQRRLEDILKRMVLAHEFGHMTFRRLRNGLKINERESLANWFSCLLADEYNKKLIESLIPYQGEEYSDFIVIPDKYNLKKKQYKEYVEKVDLLLKGW